MMRGRTVETSPPSAARCHLERIKHIISRRARLWHAAYTGTHDSGRAYCASVKEQLGVFRSCSDTIPLHLQPAPAAAVVAFEVILIVTQNPPIYPIASAMAFNRIRELSLGRRGG